MPPAGSVTAPVITPLKIPEAGKPLNHVDSNTNIEIKSATPGSSIFFTTNGSRPEPFGKPGKGSTVRYKGPFQLNHGRRVVKAIAVSRDGQNESKVVTKTFAVEYADAEDDNIEDDDQSFQMDTRTRFQGTTSARDVMLMSQSMNTGYSNGTYQDPYSNPVMSRSQTSLGFGNSGPMATLNGPVEHIMRDRYRGQTNPEYFFHYHLHETPRASFNTPQAWQGTTMQVPALMNSSAGTQTAGMYYPTPDQNKRIQEQEEEIKMLRESIETQKFKLTDTSPGKGYWKKQIQHIAAHLEAYAQRDAEFKAAIGQPKMGKISAADVDDNEDDEITISVTFQLKEGASRKNDIYKQTAAYDKEPRRPRKPTNKRTPAKKQDKLSGADYRLLKEVGAKGSGNPDEVQDLLDEGANANCQSADNIPVLTVAVMNNHVDCIPTLVDAGADVNAKADGRNGNTALHEGVLLGPDGQEAIEALLDDKANPKRKNNRGDTPYDIAIKKGYESIAALFASSMGQDAVGKFSGGSKGRRMSRDSQMSDRSTKTTRRQTYREKRAKDNGTVVEAPNFNAQKDSEVLRKAMKGFGTDEKAIIEVLTKRINRQRQKISREFKTMYGKDLIKELHGETSGNFRTTLMGLMKKPAEFDASEVNKAVKGLGTDEDALIEILCTRDNAEILAIKDEYDRLFKKSLEDDVISDTSGHFRRVLVSCIQGNRPEGDEVDPDKAKEDAEALYKAGEKKWGTDESTFNMIMSSRSYAQLRATFDEYAKLSKYDIEQSIKREMSGDLKESMLTIVRCVQNKNKYFADKLYKTMKGAGTKDDPLIRIVVSRCEIDMINIKKEFQTAYNKSLGKFIAEDTSGDYKKTLVSLVGGES
ncbi:uncharacterized protein LOC144443887 isoform X2 [Glandiceps talaboti]